jgi:Zn-dependent protease
MSRNPVQLIVQFLPFFVVILLSVSLHEFAHCWTTDRLGDDTPRRLGRVTLNPLKHLDPLGTLMMVVSAMVGFGFGWGKPSVFNPLNFRHPARDRMLTAIAGPVCNLLQMMAWASFSLICVELNALHLLAVSWATVLIELGKIGMLINASLALFNLIPIYPLDGHHILSYLAPESWRPLIDNRNWQFVFLAIVFIPPLRDAVFQGFLMPIIGALLKGASAFIGLGGLFT